MTGKIYVQAQKCQWKLFAEALPLIWRRRERILADARLFGSLTPMRILMACVSMKDSGPYGCGGPGMNRIRGALHAHMLEMRRADADLFLLRIAAERPQQPLGRMHRMRLPTAPRRRRQFRTPCFTDHAYRQRVSASAEGRCLVGERSHGTSK